MKKKVLIFTFSLILLLLPAVFTAEANDPQPDWLIDIDLEVLQQQQQQSGGKSSEVSKILSTHQVYSINDLPNSVRVLFNPKQLYEPWREKPFYRYDELDLKDEIIAWMKSGKDLFQSCGRPKKIPFNTGPMRVMDKLPDNPLLPELWSFFLEGPINGFNRETFRRGASIAKVVTNTNYIIQIPVEAIFTESAVNSAGLNTGISWLEHNSNPAVSAGLNRGDSEGRAWRVPGVVTICYPPLDYQDLEAAQLFTRVSAPSSPIKKPIQKNNILGKALFGANGIAPAKLDDLASKIADKIRPLVKSGQQIGFEGIGRNNQLSKTTAHELMVAVGTKLLGNGLTPGDLDEAFMIRAKKRRSEKEEEILHKLQEKDIHGVVVIRQL